VEQIHLLNNQSGMPTMFDDNMLTYFKAKIKLFLVMKFKKFNNV